VPHALLVVIFQATSGARSSFVRWSSVIDGDLVEVELNRYYLRRGWGHVPGRGQKRSG
jgi:hypothetical protein